MPGDYFAPHSDGSFACDVTGQRSFITVMLYLNTPIDGGETNFLSRRPEYLKRVDADCDGSCVSVHPTTGSALFFDHQMYHEGALLNKGVKYAVRTDVMFERVS